MKKTERDLLNKLKEVDAEIMEVKESLKAGQVAKFFTNKKKGKI